MLIDYLTFDASFIPYSIGLHKVVGDTFPTFFFNNCAYILYGDIHLTQKPLFECVAVRNAQLLFIIYRSRTQTQMGTSGGQT